MERTTKQPHTNSGGGVRGDLRASLTDGAAFGVMVGLGETYLPAFALAVGLSELAAGLVSSVPLLAGGLMQLISPWAVRVLRSHRRWVVMCAAIQALSFVPLFRAASTGSIHAATLMIVASCYWAAGLATGPAWNTWIETLVPGSLRHRFFARRTRLSQVFVFAGFLFGGLLLQFSSHRERTLEAFAVLFALAGLARVVSVLALRRQREPEPLPEQMRTIPWRLVIHHLRASSGGKLLTYLVVVQSAVQIAGPFFTPFMLKQLGFTYGELVGLISLAFLAKVISLPFWGQMSKSIGARRLLWIGGIGIAPLSGCWLVSQDLAWLGAVQIAGGVSWAAYELAFFLLFFESIPAAERTSVLTIYNLLNTLAWVAGSLVGAAVLMSFEFRFSGYLVVFGISSLGRIAALGLLKRIPSLDVDLGEVGVRTVAVRPGASAMDAPVLPDLPDQLATVE